MSEVTERARTGSREAESSFLNMALLRHWRECLGPEYQHEVLGRGRTRMRFLRQHPQAAESMQSVRARALQPVQAHKQLMLVCLFF